MRKVEYAWIEQILSFDSEEEFKSWYKRKIQKNVKNKGIQLLECGVSADGRFFQRIKVPYNQSKMEVNINEFFTELENNHG